MASNDYQTIQQTVADRTGLTSSSQSALVQRAIFRAIRHYRSTQLGFNEAQSTFATVSGTAAYSQGSGASNYPEDLLHPLLLEITISSSKFYLCPKTIDQIRRWEGDPSVTGQTAFWAWFDDKITLFPTPDGTYTITLDYIQNLSGPTNFEYDGSTWIFYDEDEVAIASNATSEWFDEAEALIVARAEWDLYQTRRDYPAAAVAKTQEQEALRELRSRFTRQQGQVSRELYL